MGMSTFEDAVNSEASRLGLGDRFAVDAKTIDRIMSVVERMFGESPEAWYGGWSVLRGIVIANVDGMVNAMQDNSDATSLVLIMTHFIAIIGAILVRFDKHPMVELAMKMRDPEK
jgi:hypothetical protein